MRYKSLLSIFFVLFFLFASSQENHKIALLIPQELMENANAVVRYDNIHIDIRSYNKMIYNNRRVVTILNKEGESKVGAFEFYDKNVHIRKLEAEILDANGNQIKKFKKKDFIDVSAVPGGTLYSDNRVKYLKYVPINYPYTVVYEAEIEYETTAFLPGWRIIEGFYTSTQNAEYKITNSSEIELKVKTSNFENYNIEKLGEFHYKAKKIKAIKYESNSPSFKSYAPHLKAALTEFDMEGVRGENKGWKNFGKWMNDNLITGSHELPQKTINEIKVLTANVKTKREKAKIVYSYMQNKTRYISVQVGIGGWKPMLASDVDRLGYGDCKALTNYTKALLDEVNVESYYSVVYGDNNLKNIDKEFSATEGNHVILAVPDKDEYIWLECTSQTAPFGYNANFTDDRDVLIIKPDGGEIVHTKVYKTEENIQTTSAKVEFDDLGNFIADIKLVSQGTQYGYHQGIARRDDKDKTRYYKNYFDNINNLEIDSVSLDNNKDNIVFTENLDVKASDYASKAGQMILLEPNMFNKMKSIPPRYKERKLPFEIDRGYIHIDEFEINFPETLQVEALKDPVSIKNKFGEYIVSIQKNSENSLVYNRKLVVNKGLFEKEDYKAFREFCLKIVKHDKSKIALKKKL